MPLEFKDPGSIEPAGVRTAAVLVSAAADLTLVLDRSGIITDLSHNLDLRPDKELRKWRGRAVASVVKADSRSRLDRALQRVRGGRRSERFDVNHLLEGDADLPIQYSAVAIADVGRIVLLGRDLRPVSDLQSRLLDNLRSIENTVRSQKQIEARYRLLFEASSDAIAFIDPETEKVREMNPRAGVLLGVRPTESVGRKFTAMFDRARRAEVKTMLSAVSASGTSGRLGVELQNAGDVLLNAELFRAGEFNLIMVRFVTSEGKSDGEDPTATPGLDLLARNASEAIVLTDAEGGIIWANESFLVIAAVPLAAHAIGKPVDEFFQWSSVERQALFDNVRRHGRAPVFAGTVRGAKGQATEVEVSAVAMNDGSLSGYGFVMRERGADETTNARSNSDLTRTAEGLAEMIGRVPMKDLVRDTTDVIERMCIEAALKLTGNNRASTARVLGLSRQALYLKMNRFGIADSD